ncbi:hypothetical protein TGAMA5MH_09229 [Trichoderma gamsii]|uniref:Zn(2)-C6 fungal-type domain-containing protein n=1 Tax=Trichoderma gamsii TaxID=398673 RepID=A0A2K0T0F8_9HYPO|nr:hypothetical protein TGAMA5MH_09229 [Trichoderma gamsii]
MDAASTRRHEPSHTPPDHEHETDGGPQAKKRKVRKGTRSCWECRRRKMKCIFGSPADTICVSCQRRGAKCVDQQFPEQISTPLDRSLQMGDRVVRVEALVEQLLKKMSSGSDSCCGCGTTQEDEKFSKHDDTPQYEILDRQGIRPPHLVDSKSRSIQSGKYKDLSRALFEALPTPKDIAIISKARGDLSARFYQMLTVSYHDLGKSDPQSLGSLFEPSGPNTHPVLIGLYMLRIATFLQHLHPNLHENLKGLSEPPRQIMNRLFNTAVNLVNSNESLLNNIEGIECVMMESLWHTNGGDLRKGLTAIRRAMTIAQLMGFHRSRSSAQCRLLGSERQVQPKFIWFRIVFAERHICLMLGLPQSSIDQSMASNEVLESDTPMGRLERKHCVIASRILQRNQSEPSPDDFALTQELDKELQKAAEELPKKWWLHSNLATVLDDPERLFWDMRRLFHQLFHYTLLNQLHLPYMLRSSLNGYESQYSRLTCVTASREVLSRFITFRSADRIAFWCRTMDWFSLMAAMTLLIAHLDGHRRGSESARLENWLTHQRPGDRAMIEQVHESMEEVSQRNGDALGARSVELLRKLLVIEAEAAGGHAENVNRVNVQVATADDPVNEERSGAVRVYIPYFGTIKIARGGIISKEMLTDAADQHSTQAPEANLADDIAGTAKTWDSTLADAGYGSSGVLTHADTMPESFSQQEEDSLFTSGFDDWAYQSVDVAFFDSLMREIGDGPAELG